MSFRKTRPTLAQASAVVVGMGMLVGGAVAAAGRSRGHRTASRRTPGRRSVRGRSPRRRRPSRIPTYLDGQSREQQARRIPRTGKVIAGAEGDHRSRAGPDHPDPDHRQAQTCPSRRSRSRPVTMAASRSAPRIRAGPACRSASGPTDPTPLPLPGAGPGGCASRRWASAGPVGVHLGHEPVGVRGSPTLRSGHRGPGLRVGLLGVHVPVTDGYGAGRR